MDWTTTTTALIIGSHGSWAVSDGSAMHRDVLRHASRTVQLRISGTEVTGYHLIKSPVDHFTADDWFETRAGAFEAARAEFGVDKGDWAPANESPGEP